MNPLARLFLIGGAFMGVAGCLGTPSDAPQSDSVLLVASDADGPMDEALVDELWCPSCVSDGLRALSLSHDVRFHTSRGTDTIIVEIDGVIACAGHSSEPLEELDADGDTGGGEDEGNPDPEPALPGVLLPSPVTRPHVERKEDEGNPDPEPALDKPLPGPRPTLSESHGL